MSLEAGSGDPILQARGTLVRARMHKFIIHDEVAACGERREDCGVGNKSAAEEQRTFCLEKLRGLRFERLVFCVVAPQEP